MSATTHGISLWKRACIRKHAAGRQVWESLHEPRVFTILYLSFYLASMVAGLAMIFGWVPTVLPEGIDTLEGVIMFAGGLLGLPACWRGTWYLERGAIGMISLVGVVLLLAAFFDLHAKALRLEPVPTASWSFGIYCWLLACLVRCAIGVGIWPYAPGKGPLTTDAREARAVATLQRQNEESNENGR